MVVQCFAWYGPRERERDTHTRMTSAGGKTNSASSYFPRRNPVTPHTRLEAHTHTKETTKSSCMRFQQKNTSENRIELLFSLFFVSGGFFFPTTFYFSWEKLVDALLIKKNNSLTNFTRHKMIAVARPYTHTSAHERTSENDEGVFQISRTPKQLTHATHSNNFVLLHWRISLRIHLRRCDVVVVYLQPYLITKNDLCYYKHRSSVYESSSSTADGVCWPTVHGFSPKW